MSEGWDVVVVGAGPAGMAAAALLAEQQARVVLLDEQPAPGGQIYRGIERAAQHRRLFDALGPEYALGAALAARFRASGAAYRPGSLVWQVTPDREVWFSQGGRSHALRAGVVILATGAMERPVPLPGWTLPGVMTAGAVQILLKTSGLVASDPLVLAGSGPLLLLLAQQGLAAGMRPAAVLDTTPFVNKLRALRHLPGAAARRQSRRYLAKGFALQVALQRSGVQYFRHVSDIQIEGTRAVSGITFRSGSATCHLPARLVALHEGVIPAQQITRSIGCDHVWDPRARCFRAWLDEWGHTSVDRIMVAGDGGGISGARAAEHGGRLAALEALRQLGRIDGARRDTLAVADRKAWAAHAAIRPFLDILYAPRQETVDPADGVMVCRCEDISAGAVRAVVRQGCLGPNQAKAFLRAGMGPCQGRMCGPVISEVIAAARGVSPAEVGYYRIRPPLKPVTLGELAALETTAP